MSTIPHIPAGANLYSSSGNISSNSLVTTIRASRPPTTYDTKGPQGNFVIGQDWVYSMTGGVYYLTQLTSSNGQVSATWTLLGVTGGALATLSGDTGTATPTLGNIQIAGTANEITTAASGSAVTLSLPTNLIAPGSVEVTTTLGVGQGILTDASLTFAIAGGGLVSTNKGAGTSAGANVFGNVVLDSGSATISTTGVRTGSIILLSRLSVGSTGSNALGTLTVGTVVNATSFVINAVDILAANSLVTTDLSVVSWMIIN